MRWLYTDYRVSPPAILFECDAPDIMSADKLCLEATQVNPAKQVL
jgi:hypothetical protein